MKKILVLTSTLVLLGLSCSLPARQNVSLPSTPPEGAYGEDSSMMEKKTEDKMMADKSADEGVMAEKSETEMMAEKSGEDKAMADKVSAGAAAVPYYIAYSAAEFERARQAKKATLLYFWAVWCPICKAEEPKIQSIVESSGLNVAGFRVDFDTEAALKQQFNIPYQHTTVILNTQGVETARFTGPTSEATLLEALRTASASPVKP